MATPAFTFSTHDSHPPEDCALIDAGLGAFNAQAAALHEVQPIACFARTAAGPVVGGAVGRWWGTVCELQQLWVEPAHRGKGIGRQLIQDFEARAVSNGCICFFLETFSFQAPGLYLALGYEVAYENADFPHGIRKVHMVKRGRPQASGATSKVFQGPSKGLPNR